jgi:hypothetical protein
MHNMHVQELNDFGIKVAKSHCIEVTGREVPQEKLKVGSSMVSILYLFWVLCI